MKARSRTTTSAQPEYQAGVSHLVAVALLAMGTACQGGGGPDAAAEAPDDTVVELPMPIIHHVGLNVIDPGCIDGLVSIGVARRRTFDARWQAGVPGRPFAAATPHGTCSTSSTRSTNQLQASGMPTSSVRLRRAFSGISEMFVDTTSLKNRFDAVGVTMAPMWETLDGREIWRSGGISLPRNADHGAN